MMTDPARTRPQGQRVQPALRLLAIGAGLATAAASLPVAAAGDAAAGAAAWTREYPQPDGSARSCASCHTEDLTQPGRHARTGKPIEPLAPSVNPERLTDPKEVEKWLYRNCRWTLGRECTAAEKADLLAYIERQ
jgi:mono/diheme cytochrome c family protein